MEKGHTKVDELDRVIERQPVSSVYKPHGMSEWTFQKTKDRAKYMSEKSDSYTINTELFQKSV